MAVDLGASGGRVELCALREGRLEWKELHRFSNDPVFARGTLYWDVYRLLYEIQQGIWRAKDCGGAASVAIDTWGVDFGLLNRLGELTAAPVHYRDGRTRGMLGELFKRIDEDTLYRVTGIPPLEINTATQLLAMQKRGSAVPGQDGLLLMMPSLLAYLLGGEAVAEASSASTSQLFDPDKRDWAYPVAQALGLSCRLPRVVPSGTVTGTVEESLCRQNGIAPPQIIAACGHDTQCAIAAVPAEEEEFLFLCTGTWALMGTEVSSPIRTPQAQRGGFSNEAAFGGKISFLKNATGLWLIQESRRQWAREGENYSFGQLERMAAAAPFAGLVDTDDPQLSLPGDLPGRIRALCRKTGQAVPQGAGEIVRCIDESLAMKYRWIKEEIEACTGRRYQKLYLVGGGVQSALLCQMTANACGIPVIAGGAEATAMGNALVQLITLGEIPDLAAARRISAASAPRRVYWPQEDWSLRYRDVYRPLLAGSGEK